MESPTLSLISFETFDSSGRLIDSGGPPPGGRFVIDAVGGTGIVSGPPGEYPFQPGCAPRSFGPFSSGIPSTDSPLVFTLTGADAPEPAAPPDSAPAAPPAATHDSGQAGNARVDNEMGERAQARAIDVQARHGERQAEIEARTGERQQAVAAREVERAQRTANRQAERDAELAIRAAELAERKAERSRR